MSVAETLRQWVELGTGLTTIYHQPAQATDPRPPKPYATINVRSSAPVSSTPRERTTDEPDPTDPAKVIQRRSWLRQGTVRVRLYGTLAQPSREELARLALSVRRRDVRDLLYAAGVTVRHLGDLADVPTPRDTTWEDQSQSDYQFRHVDVGESPVDWIETATVDMTYG